MSDTPRTDSACGVGSYTHAVDSDLSRSLERELNAANERIKQLESDQKRSMSRIMRMEVAGDNLVVCATCDVSDASQFVSAWRRSKHDTMPIL